MSSKFCEKQTNKQRDRMIGNPIPSTEIGATLSLLLPQFLNIKHLSHAQNYLCLWLPNEGKKSH